MNLIFCLLSVFCVFISGSSAQTRGNQVPCETMGVENWTHVGPQKTCYIKINTWINSTGCSISSTRETTTGLSLWGSKKIYFLPVKVAESFPNLLVYGANACSVRSISKENFKNLSNMKRLDIGHNFIETVPTDTFEDCIALEWLQIASNKIKSLNGESFTGLKRLQKVVLSGNVCVNEDFVDPTSIATLPQVINEKCQKPVESRITLNPDSVAELEAELAKCLGTMDLIKELVKPISGQKTAQKTEALRQSERLLVILQQKNDEINEKNLRIKALEEKVRALESGK